MGDGHGTQDGGGDPWNVKIALVFGKSTQLPASRDKDKVTMADGGGVRGYFSLLVLEYLIQEIQNEERRLQGKIKSSFYPCDCPPTYSEVATPFLPCHYFDYIGGTSTGACVMLLHTLGIGTLTVAYAV